MSPKIRNIVTWVVTGLLALLMLASGAMKFINPAKSIMYFETFGDMGSMLQKLIGVFEIAGAIAVIALPKLRSLAAIGLMIIMFGAVYSHLQVEGDMSNSMGAVLGAVLCGLTIFLWSRNRPPVQS